MNLLDVITCNRRPSHSSGLPICKAVIPSLRRSPTYCSQTKLRNNCGTNIKQLHSDGVVHARRVLSHVMDQTPEV